MKTNTFISKLHELKPDFNLLITRGYDEISAKKLIDSEFVPKKKLNTPQESELLFFLNNYDLDFFRIRHIDFTDRLEYINEFMIVGGFDGGYLGQKEPSGEIFLIYNDDFEYIHEIFAQNDSQFFEILLIIAEYSSKVSEGKIDPFDEEIKEIYYLKCHEICAISSCEFMF